MSQRKEIGARPLCGLCFDEMIKFIDTVNPDFASGFALLKIKEYANETVSRKIKASLQAIRDSGKNLGRRKVIDDSKILELRKNGFTYSQITRALNYSKGAVQRAIKGR